MTKPRYNWNENNVLALCPDCEAVTSFDDKGFSNTKMGISIVDKSTSFEGRQYSRVLWHGLRCSNCGRGAIAKILDNGNSRGAVIQDFVPQAIQKASLPASVPQDIVAEFRESELCAVHAAYRSGSAMLRSVLEKTLKKNGYDEVEYDDKGTKKKSRALLHRINAASEDGVLTETRRKKAHENIRVLGNDILHDDWREVAKDEFDEAHKYAQRILEDFYDDRPTIEAQLKAKGRIP
jgi:Domain of unknown function (DUF4145)